MIKDHFGAVSVHKTLLTNPGSDVPKVKEDPGSGVL